jgi:hypothetical protein
VTGFTPPRIFSPYPGVIYLSHGTNLPGEHELRWRITGVRFTTPEIFSATVPWRSSLVLLSEQLAGPRSPIFVWQLATHSPTYIKVVVQCTNYKLCYKDLTQTSTKSPAIRSQSSSNFTDGQDSVLRLTGSPTSCLFFSNFCTTPMLSHLIKLVPLT